MRSEAEIRTLLKQIEDSAATVLPILAGPSSCTRMAMAGVLAGLDAVLTERREGPLVEVAVAAIGRRMESLEGIGVPL